MSAERIYDVAGDLLHPLDDPAKAFSAGCSNALRNIAFDMTAPPIHETGQIELRPEGSWVPKTHFTVSPSGSIVDNQTVISQINEELHKQPAGQRINKALAKGPDKVFSQVPSASSRIGGISR